jgi:hypothetical protein
MKLLAGKRQGNRHKEKPSSSVSQSSYLDVFAPLPSKFALREMIFCVFAVTCFAPSDQNSVRGTS